MARITEAWTVASEFSSPYTRSNRAWFFPLQPAAIFELFEPTKRKRWKNFPYSRFISDHILHRRVSSADYARRRFTATRSIDRIPCESIVEMIGVTREPDDGPVLSGTFALCVALSCNTSAQPDFTGGEFRQRQWGTWVSTFRRSSICITLGKERNERVGRADRDLSLPLCLPFANRTMGLAICNPCKPLFFSGRISFRIATGEMLYTILGSNL